MFGPAGCSLSSPSDLRHADSKLDNFGGSEFDSSLWKAELKYQLVRHVRVICSVSSVSRVQPKRISYHILSPCRGEVSCLRHWSPTMVQHFPGRRSTGIRDCVKPFEYLRWNPVIELGEQFICVVEYILLLLNTQRRRILVDNQDGLKYEV